jgi:hypothetical protein
MNWLAASQLVGVAGMPGTERGVRLRAQREGWQSRPRQVQGGGVEYAIAELPTVVQTQLIAASAPQESPASQNLAWHRYESAPEKQKQAAIEAHRAVMAVAYWLETGLSVRAALERVAETGTPLGTLKNWWYACQKVDRNDWLPTLLPKYKGSEKAEIPIEAWEYFKADWLRLEQPAMTACYERVCRQAKAQGWDLPVVA